MNKVKKDFNWAKYIDSLSDWALWLGCVSALVVFIAYNMNNAARDIATRMSDGGAIFVGLVYALVILMGTLFVHGILKGISKALKKLDIIMQHLKIEEKSIE
jgi:TRAP-type mannitol/chloroaromatic compound transport system permease small subunit